MDWIETEEALSALYPGEPSKNALLKVARQLTPTYRRWIEAARFCVLVTTGPEGTDASPRGDDGPVVEALDPRHLAMPDWRGNNRLDSLRNIVRDGRASLLFMVQGSNNVVRVNGRARLTADEALCARFAKKGVVPRSVIVIEISEIYFQCSRALLRSRLWSGEDESAELPSAGEILAEMTAGAIDGAGYDKDWNARAVSELW